MAKAKGVNTPRIREKDFQRAILDMATALGWRAHHETNSFGTAPGWPDLALFHPIHGALYIEVKTPPYKATAAQQEWIETLRAAGQTAYVVYPADMDAIERLLQGERLEDTAA